VGLVVVRSTILTTFNCSWNEKNALLNNSTSGANNYLPDGLRVWTKCNDDDDDDDDVAVAVSFTTLQYDTSQHVCPSSVEQ